MKPKVGVDAMGRVAKEIAAGHVPVIQNDEAS